MRLTFEALVERARGLPSGDRRAVLGIAGAPGAGKTTLAEALVAALATSSPPGWVAHVPMDGFHLADAELARLGLGQRKGAPETIDALGYAAMLRRLREDRDEVVYAPGFERGIEQPIAGAIAVDPRARLIVSEGNYLLLDEPRWARARSWVDEVWFAELDRPERLRRLVERHVRFGKDEAAATAWAEGTDERNAVAVAATRDRADLVVPSAVMLRVGAPPSGARRGPGP